MMPKETGAGDKFSSNIRTSRFSGFVPESFYWTPAEQEKLRSDARIAHLHNLQCSAREMEILLSVLRPQAP